VESGTEVSASPEMIVGYQYTPDMVKVLAHFPGFTRVKVWGIFNHLGQKVAQLPYKHEAEARLYARRWSKETRSEHFVSLVDALQRRTST
jgi:hypothetical protein